MTAEHINALIRHLEKYNELFDKYDYVSVFLSKAELQHIVMCLHDRKEPTHEEIESYCKARKLSLITDSLLAELIQRK